MTNEETSKASSQPSRRLIFLSHATPQDNVFAKWLAAQLAAAGYEVWCDVTKLLGGEQFWNNIEEAIDDHAFKFLFASTEQSNIKPGCLRELKLASEAAAKYRLKDFIIPLKVDPPEKVPFGATPQLIRDLNFVRFDEGWAAALAQLLKLLEREAAPKSTAATPQCVAHWYAKSISDDRKVQPIKNKYFSNWLKLNLPSSLFLHAVGGTSAQTETYAKALPFAKRAHAGTIITFAPAHDVQMQLGPDVVIKTTSEVSTVTFIQDGLATHQIRAGEAQRIICDLLRQAWETDMNRRGLYQHVLASGLPAWFFKKDQLTKNKAIFKLPTGKSTYRQIVGKKRKRYKGVLVDDGYWHYAISAVPQLFPEPHYVLRHHVVFTEDGEKLWEDASRMHRARRSVCKSWWNREWRDRLFAFCSWMSNQGDTVALPLSDSITIIQPSAPMSFTSAWSYYEDGQESLDENKEVELVEDADEGETDEEAKGDPNESETD